ncbi:phage tail sheath family protein [Geovibrio ferrireducens]|uniref:phage tail sheath family protein n=1 Tax=Geovibrio ferrireducens TaxID=46201 RepID=UPI0022473354|nr:hypothetical protein [Geovibrio ferrireducens]
MSLMHGINVREEATSVISMRTVDSAIPVVVGTAPINMGNLSNVNNPVICHTLAGAVTELGYVDDFSAGFSLCEAIYSQFQLYGIAPVIFINVLNPAEHKTDVAASVKTFASNKITLEYGVLSSTVVVKSEDGETTYTVNTDYALSFDKDGKTVINKLGEAITDSVSVSYTKLDPSLVTAEDIIGGIDVNTGKKTGLELISEIFPRFRVVPGLLIAPGWSHDVSVASVLAAKSEKINGLFRAMSIADIQAESVEKYSDIPAFKQQNSLVDEDMVLTWPKLKNGSKEFFQSTHLAGLISEVDANNGGIPYESPSNKNYKITGSVYNGEEVYLGLEEADYLNRNGIVTSLNWSNGWTSWGNRTAAFPDITDVKDNFIPIRRMFNWIQNTFILTYWQKIDFPIKKRNLKMIADSGTFWLNGLTSREFILGGRFEFREADNPLTDLMNGIVRFRVFVTPPSPMEQLEFILEYDLTYVSTLFG